MRPGRNKIRTAIFPVPSHKFAFMVNTYGALSTSIRTTVLLEKHILVIVVISIFDTDAQLRKPTVNLSALLCKFFCCLVLTVLLVLVADSSNVRAQPTAPYDTLVVVAPDLVPAIERWVDYRTQQGHRLLVVKGQRFAVDNRNLIRHVVAAHRKIEHLVLVGDAGDWTKSPTELLPTDRVLAEVNFMFGSEMEIATDNTYADLNGDATPELNVGRIVATDAQELEQYVDRVIQYESEASDHRDQQWRRRINLIAGLGGFGSVTDGLIESTAKQIITDKIPASYDTSVTYGSWQSPYCPDPRLFSQTTIERFNEGCLFWIYVGHGDRQRLDKVRVPKQRFDILDSESARSLNCTSGSPIAIFLACYTGAIDSSRDCLAEQMVKQPGGPVAVICGSRVTMPYAMSLLSIEMADQFFEGQCVTIGQLMRRSKLAMVSPKPIAQDDNYRQMIQSMGQSLSPLPKQLNAEKREHLHLVNLLGDPLLRLKRPSNVDLQCVGEATAGQTLKIQGVASVGGRLTIELVYRRDRFRVRSKRRRKFEPEDQKLADYQRTYRQAHDQVCVGKQLTIDAGSFETSLEIPRDVKGACEVRAMVVGDGNQKSDMALGSRSIKIVKTSSGDASSLDPIRTARDSRGLKR